MRKQKTIFIVGPQLNLPAANAIAFAKARAALERQGFATSGHPVICDTGVAFEVPEGYMLQVRSRSGLAFKHGVEAFHGTIDSDYRGTVQVLLTCAHLDDDEPPVKINQGDRIAQACIIPVPMVAFEEVDELPTTELGAAGFGSTGGR